MAAGLGYDLILLFWTVVVVKLFFREVRPRGAFNIPREGAVIFVVGPHHNQFLDPVLLASEVRKESGRRIGFIIAAKSMGVFMVGRAAKWMDSIPVARAADNAKTGSGSISLSATEPLIIKGNGTKFTKEAMVRGQMVLPKSAGYATAEVAEIISDEVLRIKSEFITAGKDGASDVKATSRIVTELARLATAGEGGLAYKNLPYIDQHDVYGHVYKRLQDGGCIGIFPEGGSHDRPDLLPLKAGFAIMALGAMSSDPNLKIKLVPVGLSYFHAHKFRSRAVVEFGAPLDVDRELVDLFAKGGKDKREACGRLLEMVHDGLKAVTLRAPDFETLMVVQAGRRLYKTPGQHLTLGQVVELNKRFIEGYLHYQHEPRIIELRRKITTYNRKLRDLGLRDHQVDRATNTRRLRNLVILLYRSGLLLAWAILALPGVILHAPIFIPAKIYSHRKAKSALAASTVKIAGRDVLATWKVLISLGLTPVLYIVYATLATYIAWNEGVQWNKLKFVPMLVITLLPFFAMSALRFGEAGMDVFKSLRPLFLSLLPGSQKRLYALKHMRESLSEELSEIINEFGPQLYENFHESRLLPSASVPQTGSTPGLLYRKTTKPDSSVLSHPMLWLDERIFGWSRSAGKGQSAWEGKNMASRVPTAPGSPNESDEEELDEDVDYDDVLAIIDTHKPNPASRSGSYQRKRGDSNSLNGDDVPEVPESAIAEGDESSAVRHRKAHNRTSSLNDSMNLGDLTQAAKENGDKPFEVVTKQLNAAKEEVEKQR